MAQLIYGKNVVKQILTNPSKVHEIYLASDDREIEALCRKGNVRVKKTDRKALTKMVKSENHQGVVASIDEYKTYTVDDIVNNKKNKYGFIVMLDELEDPHNLGAILRTADAVDCDGVIFRKDRSVGLTPTVAKVSTGAIDTVKCAPVTNLVRTAEELQKKGYWLVAADMDGEDYRRLNYDFNTVLVIGNEGKGISRLLREKCDHVVSLPMRGQIESLNASVSAGILMYEINSKRFPL